MRKEFLKICENDHKKIYIHNDTIGTFRNQQRIEDLVRSAYFIIFKMGGEPMVILKAVGEKAIKNMKNISNNIKIMIESEGLYNVKCKELDDVRYGRTGPIYSSIEVRVVENEVKVNAPKNFNANDAPKFVFN